MEARVFNVEGLAKLNKKAAEIFSNNAMQQPNPSTTQAWGNNIRARKSNKIPKGVAALAQKIVDDDDEARRQSEEDNVDPFAVLERMSASLIEDDLVGDFLKPVNSTEN